MVAKQRRNPNYEQNLTSLVEQTDERGILGLAPSISLDILRERCVWLTGAPLVLLQIAHPVIAYGVQQHTRKLDGPSLHQRFIDTLIYNQRVLFAPTLEMLKISRFVYTTHERVSGVIQEACGPFRAGDKYSAVDASALLWVYATGIEHSVFNFEFFVRRLSDSEKEAYYQFVRRIAPVWGLASDQMPSNWIAFQSYFATMIQNGSLCKTRPAETIVDSVFANHFWRKASRGRFFCFL